MIPFHTLWEGWYEAMYLGYYEVIELRAPKYNSGFSEESNYTTKFIRPFDQTHQWTCAVCGKKRGRAWFWTSIIPFKPVVMFKHNRMVESQFLPAFTPICSDHPFSTFSVSDDFLPLNH